MRSPILTSRRAWPGTQSSKASSRGWLAFITQFVSPAFRAAFGQPVYPLARYRQMHEPSTSCSFPVASTLRRANRRHLASSLMTSSKRIAHFGLAEALAKGPPPPDNLAVPIFSHGSLVVELYTPVGQDPQKPHTRDEVYFVTRGAGSFFDGEQRHSVAVGSFLFVRAGQVHRFEDFSPDFVVWVVFYGPEGGEAGANNEGGIAGKRS